MDRDRDNKSPPLPPSSSSSQPFSHDIVGMPDNPPKNRGHRRAHSEIITLPDDLTFDTDLALDDDFLALVDHLNSPPLPEDNNKNIGNNNNYRSSNNDYGVATERPRVRHQHSHSMDLSIQPDMLFSGADDVAGLDAKKAMSADKLAELALIDPKRAKRIWANRQSAARSKERKMRYISELERKVQTLQTEATSLSAQLTLLQRDTNGLNAENGELKLRLQTMEQQVHLQDALNDALKEEIQHLKLMTGQAIPNGGSTNFASFGGGQQFYPNNHAMYTLLAAQKFQQLQIQSQKQQQHQLQQQQQQFQQHQLQHQLQQQQQKQTTATGTVTSTNGALE